MKSRARAKQAIITMGRAAEGRSLILIILLLALALDFILGSKVYLSV